MKKPLLNYYYNRIHALFSKLQLRLNKNFSTGRFRELSKQKQYKLLIRLEKLKLQLSRIENKLKYGSLALAASAGVSLTATESLSQALPAGSEFRVNTYTTGVQMSAKTAMDSDGDFVVTWTSRNQDDPTEYGVYAQRYNAQGAVQGAEFRVNTYTVGRQNYPVIAMDDNGNFVIVWTSNGQDGEFGGIFGQRFNAAGQALGAEFQVNVITAGNQYMPSVAMDSDGDFAVTWSSPGPAGASYEIYARCYDAAGAAKTGEIHVNTTTTGLQRFSTIAMDNDGDFVVAWQSDLQDGNFYGIYGQRFAANGLAQGSEFKVNTYTTNQQKSMAAAMDQDGDFVIAWQSSGQDGSGDGIYAQRYNANGITQGDEFRVNTYTTDLQTLPSVAMNNNEFIISWTSYGQDGSDNGVYAQLYNAAGIAQGSEFKVNSYTTGSQNTPAIAIDNTNNIIIAWTSANQDGSSNGVYAQRLEGNLAPTDIALNGNTVNENIAANTTIGTFTTADIGKNTFTYTLVAGSGDTDNASFIIAGDKLQIKISPDFETKNSYSIRVRSADHGGLSFEKAFTIKITNVNEAPTNILLSSATLSENAPANTVVGTFTTTDADAGDKFTYSLVSGTGSDDNSTFTIVGNTLQINVSPDFETKNSYSIRVRSTDLGGLSFEKAFVITIENIEETGIAGKNEFSASIQLYPNPARETVMINLEGSVMVRIMDLSGHVIKQNPVNNQIISLEGLSAGIYMLEFTQDGKTGMKKLVIE